MLKLIKIQEVQAKTGRPSRHTIYRWEKLGQFPKRKRIGKNSVAWLESEIDDWILSHCEKVNYHKSLKDQK